MTIMIISLIEDFNKDMIIAMKIMTILLMKHFIKNKIILLSKIKEEMNQKQVAAKIIAIIIILFNSINKITIKWKVIILFLLLTNKAKI
jgi:hypothetical protein